MQSPPVRLEYDLRRRSASMPIDVHERLLNNAKNRNRDRLFEHSSIFLAAEAHANSSSPTETVRQGLQRFVQATAAQFGGMMEKGERSDLSIDLTDRILNLFDQAVPATVGIHARQPGDAQLQRYQQLPSGIVKFLAYPPPFVILYVQETSSDRRLDLR